MEREGQLPFLDVNLTRLENSKLRLKVYRKATCSNIYLHWKSFAPEKWKIGTLQGMLRRAYLICSDETDLNNEINFLTDVFKNLNGYPPAVIERCRKHVEEKMSNASQSPATDSETENKEEEKKIPYLVLPYMGEKGAKIAKMLKRKIPENIRPKVLYKGTKLSTFFSTKDRIKDMHCSNLVYEYRGSGGELRDDYIGETKCRLGTRIQQHQRSDKESAIYQNYTNKNIDPPDPKDFSILAKNYNNRMKRRIAESLYIKEMKPSLNIQKDAYQLRLFR